MSAYSFHLLAATIVQNKAVSEQGMEEGEEEENRGKEKVEDMGLGWMEDCCAALERHAADPAVQVGHTFLWCIWGHPEKKSCLWSLNLCRSLQLPQEAASWAIHNLLLHGVGGKHSEEEQKERYSIKWHTHTHTLYTYSTLMILCLFVSQDSCSQTAYGGHAASLLLSQCVWSCY